MDAPDEVPHAIAYAIGAPVSGGFHVSTTPLPTVLASSTPGAVGFPTVTVTWKLELAVKKPSVTDTVMIAVPPRPSSGVIRNVHAPVKLVMSHVTLNADGATGSSVVFDEASDTCSAFGMSAPAIVNGTVTDPFCGMT